MQRWKRIVPVIRAGFLAGLVVASRGLAESSSQVAVIPASPVTVHVALELPGDLPASPGRAARLVEVGGSGGASPVQWTTSIRGDGSQGPLGSRLLARVEACSGPRRFRLEAGPAAEEASPFRFEEVSAASLRLAEGNHPVFVYNHGTITDERVPARDVRRSRACYLHPVWGLNGEILTDDFPKDHWHHHGIFWTWPHVRIEDREYDLWVGRGIQQRFVRWLARETGPLAAVLGVENGWFVGDEKVMIERVWMRPYRSEEDSRTIDLEFAWIPVGRAVTLWGAAGKSYGGVTMRFAPRREKSTVITVPEGRTSADLAETPLAWADLSGRFEGRTEPSGAAVFIHPAHPDYPPTWLTRHYGCLCVGWPGVHSKTFAPGQVIRAGYRVWIHRAGADAETVRRAYAGYTAAAEARWE